ncbi:DNA polymerase III subunit gamma and tau [Gryllotalpicola protaetiae]|uniref:DNA-directed DNA polymerase n=1 Tax=Gryllotalpicola protaetiae TaxID=2419771 RepID=A0A387C0U5_9MICO|nr:DNA polymerase III subunit gamma and tau [Gryllotalpicola protaetiae]AYG04151.1 DNA polymerase III subunit gamma and tau [Gryllotalpicola protaetiae]
MVTALYRRYRPETFAEMIGQSQVTEPLMTALRTNRVNHAYLFSGPRGCGKTTSARILARCLNCAEGPTDTPCGTCPSCVELGRGGQGSLDVVEIDAASHNGVDDARDIRERAVFAPARDRYKIFILDEAHMVTSAGFNALLKIVEEPPEHVKFIFATTEPEKVIGTIRSRTHHYPFRLVPPAMMLDYVQKLTAEEGMNVAPGVLPLVVRAGGGSPRDTLSLLDQLIAGSEGDEIGYERAVALLGYTHSALLDEIVEAMAARDSSTAFAAIDRVIQTGQDPRRFVEDLLERLRDLIIIAAAGPDKAAAVLRGTPADELERMGAEARAFGSAELSRIADIVNAALTEMSGATSPRLHLELMIARALIPTADEAGSMARVERLERRVGVTDASTKAPAPAPPVAEPAPQRDDDPAARRAAGAERAMPARDGSADGFETTAARGPGPSAAPGGWATPGVTGVDEEAPVAAAESAPREPGSLGAPGAAAHAVAAQKPDAQPQVAPKPVGPVTLQLVKDAWPQVLDAVKAVKSTAWLVVATATVRKFENDVLTLTFPSENDIASFRPQAGQTQNVSDVLRESIQKILGVRVKFVAKTATDFAQSLKAEGFGVTPSAAPAPSAPAPAPAATSMAPTAPRQSEAPRREAAPRDVVEAGAVGAPQQSESGTPRLTAVPPQPKDATPVTTWATVAIPGGGSAAAAPKPAEAPAVEERPKLQAVPPLPKESTAEASVAPAVDDEGWSTVAPSDDDAPSFDEDPDASPIAAPTSDGRAAPQARVETPPVPKAFDTPTAPATQPPVKAEAAGPRKGPSFSTDPREHSSPGPQRYGEAVVREILNARFIEEQQLPDGNGGR